MSSLSAFRGSAYILDLRGDQGLQYCFGRGFMGGVARGVDVLVCIDGAIKTPNYVFSEPEQTGGLGDLTMTPVQVVHEALKVLGKGPYVIPGRMNRVASFFMRHLLPRKAAVKLMGRVLKQMYVKSGLINAVLFCALSLMIATHLISCPTGVHAAPAPALVL